MIPGFCGRQALVFQIVIKEDTFEGSHTTLSYHDTSHVHTHAFSVLSQGLFLPHCPSYSLSTSVSSSLREKIPPQGEVAFWVLSVSPNTVISVCFWCVLPGVTGAPPPSCCLSTSELICFFREQGAKSPKGHTLGDPSTGTATGQKQERLLASWHQTKGWHLLCHLFLPFWFRRGSRCTFREE